MLFLGVAPDCQPWLIRLGHSWLLLMCSWRFLLMGFSSRLASLLLMLHYFVVLQLYFPKLYFPKLYFLRLYFLRLIYSIKLVIFLLKLPKPWEDLLLLLLLFTLIFLQQHLHPFCLLFQLLLASIQLWSSQPWSIILASSLISYHPLFSILPYSPQLWFLLPYSRPISMIFSLLLGFLIILPHLLYFTVLLWSIMDQIFLLVEPRLAYHWLIYSIILVATLFFAI